MPIRRRWTDALRACFLFFMLLAAAPASAQQSSVSTWDAADFRIWGYVPYWSGQSGMSVSQKMDQLGAAGLYNHVSDVLYISGVRPNSTGGLVNGSGATTHMSKLRDHATQYGFRLHMSMLETSGGTTDAVWSSITENSTYRQNFVTNINNLLNTYNMKGFNFDWERPNSAVKWGNYTQLARELRAVINPQGKEVSVCDYGSTSPLWDDTTLFDARVYDQIMIMVYHLNAAQSAGYANGKLGLIDQGAEKAFKDSQITLGIGTWGEDGPGTIPMRSFIAGNPNLPFDQGSISGTYTGINGTSYTGTWAIESRQQLREKVQVALDRGMPGMLSWTFHYDATGKLGLHRVMHHYATVQKQVPDLNLDGKVNASDANTLANNMGLVTTNTGLADAAAFDAYYQAENWEKGDRDGNGFVNQEDADWLAARYTALGVNLPDRLAYSGTFENFANSRGLTGRWRAGRARGVLRETGNFTQHGTGGLAWSGSGLGAGKFSTQAVTIRNQNSAEIAANLNALERSLQADLTTPIDLGQTGNTYFTFLVRQNTAPLTATQLASPNRTLSLEFFSSNNVNQFDVTFRGQQQDFSIQSRADSLGQDVTAGGFAPNITYLLVGKIAGNGSGINTIQASLFANGATVGNFASPNFPWMLTAESSAGYNPVITQLQFRSLIESNYTVSNVWVGDALQFFAPKNLGDFNGDGIVNYLDSLDISMQYGLSGPNLYADADGDGQVGPNDLAIWRAHYGFVTAGGAGAGFQVPEPSGLSAAFAACAIVQALWARKRRP